MNKIYRNLIAVFVAVTGILFFSLSAGLIAVNFSIETDYLGEITEQVQGNIDAAKESYDAKLRLMEEVWVERGKNAEYIIVQEELFQVEGALERMCTVMGAKDIHIFDQEGSVRFSTDKTALGGPLEGEEENLKRLMSKDAGKDYYVHIEESGFWEDPSYCRLVVRTEAEGCSAVCFDADTSQMGLKCEKTIIENTLMESATEYNTSIAAVGAGSGIVLGMTKNNSQTVEIQGMDSKEELLAYLEKAVKKGHTHAVINGEYSLVSVFREEGDYIIAFSLMNELVFGILKMLLFTLALFLIAVAVVIYTINYNFRKYLLNHFTEMERRLNLILEGDFQVTLEEGNNSEINKLLRVIQRLKTGYIHKSERTDKILEALGENIAIFEYVSGMNYYFFSDKMKQLLSMTDEEWESALGKKRELVSMIQSLYDARDENGVVYHRGKYLLVQVSDVENENVGVLIDQTEEISRRYALESEIKRFEKKLGTDPLTRVLNRGGFEACVKKYLEESQEEGVMIAFDLDNFKKVNDSLGHPAGDEVLRIFARCLQDMFRAKDIIGRLGGDEFSVLLTNPVERGLVERKVQVALDRINQSFGEYHTKCGVSASAGIVYTGRGAKYDQVYQMADQALYCAKKAGKGRFYVYEGEESPL
ncbi:MAG: diguanylate cyclase [Eubacteriales bacterium]|nr:diguanylate cyclase [Eubacteriales bacterium]